MKESLDCIKALLNENRYDEAQKYIQECGDYELHEKQKERFDKMLERTEGFYITLGILSGLFMGFAASAALAIFEFSYSFKSYYISALTGSLHIVAAVFFFNLTMFIFMHHFSKNFNFRKADYVDKPKHALIVLVVVIVILIIPLPFWI